VSHLSLMNPMLYLLSMRYTYACLFSLLGQKSRMANILWRLWWSSWGLLDLLFTSQPSLWCLKASHEDYIWVSTTLIIYLFQCMDYHSICNKLWAWYNVICHLMCMTDFWTHIGFYIRFCFLKSGVTGALPCSPHCVKVTVRFNSPWNHWSSMNFGARRFCWARIRTKADLHGSNMTGVHT
jgi:hypothetical protein